MRLGPAILAVLLAGCGGATPGGSSDAGSSPSDPGTFQTAQGFCSSNPKLAGGDLVGTWTIVGVCAISTNYPDNCATTTLSLSLAAQGSVTFNTDQTGSIDVTVVIKKSSIMPPSCSSAGTCAAFESDLTVGSNGIVSASCSPSTTDPTLCACEESYTPYLMQGSGSYKLELPTYLYSPDLHLQGGFLVNGNSLRLDGPAFMGTEFELMGRR